MVDLSEVNNLFLQICPNVMEKWNEHLEWWEGDERGHYNDISVFVHYTVDCYEQNDQLCLNNIFALVEKLISDGNQEVKDLMIIGFLETLQNYSSHRDYGYKVFEAYLDLQSTQAWRQLEILWEGKESLADVIRFERVDNT